MRQWNPSWNYLEHPIRAPAHRLWFPNMTIPIINTSWVSLGSKMKGHTLNVRAASYSPFNRGQFPSVLQSSAYGNANWDWCDSMSLVDNIIQESGANSQIYKRSKPERSHQKQSIAIPLYKSYYSTSASVSSVTRWSLSKGSSFS